MPIVEIPVFVVIRSLPGPWWFRGEAFIQVRAARQRHSVAPPRVGSPGLRPGASTVVMDPTHTQDGATARIRFAHPLHAEPQDFRNSPDDRPRDSPKPSSRFDFSLQFPIDAPPGMA